MREREREEGTIDGVAIRERETKRGRERKESVRDRKRRGEIMKEREGE